MPFGPVHRQGHQPAACSCSSLVSTRLTLGKYSCDQTLLPTGKNKASVSERAACSLPAPAHVFPGKVKINPGHRVESGYFSTAGKGQAGQWDRTGKTGKEGKKKQERFFCLHLQYRNTSRWRRESGQQADPVCLQNSRIGSWISIQEFVGYR